MVRGGGYGTSSRVIWAPAGQSSRPGPRRHEPRFTTKRTTTREKVGPTHGRTRDVPLPPFVVLPRAPLPPPPLSPPLPMPLPGAAAARRLGRRRWLDTGSCSRPLSRASAVETAPSAGRTRNPPSSRRGAGEGPRRPRQREEREGGVQRQHDGTMPGKLGYVRSM